MPMISPQRFKAMARKGERPGAVTLRKEMIAAATQIGERVLRFVISTAAPDRENDTIALDGWMLEAYRRNPVVLWAHQQDHLPVGKAFDLDVADGALKASVEFVPADVPHIGEKAEAVLRLCLSGFLSATSVGFRPLEYDIATERDDGEGWFPPMDFRRQELLEFSIVTVPCNPEALIEIPDLMGPGPAGYPMLDPAAETARAAAAVERVAAEAAQRSAEVERIAACRARRAHQVGLLEML